FQAEDGIRADLVTGVQTCALPICPIEVAERYGLLDTFKQITSDLRGDIVTLLPNGYALIDLQRVGKPLNKLSIILKKYWMQITKIGRASCRESIEIKVVERTLKE